MRKLLAYICGDTVIATRNLFHDRGYITMHVWRSGTVTYVTEVSL